MITWACSSTKCASLQQCNGWDSVDVQVASSWAFLSCRSCKMNIEPDVRSKGSRIHFRYMGLNIDMVTFSLPVPKFKRKPLKSADINWSWNLWCRCFFSICNVLSGFSKLYTDFRRIPNRFLKAFQFVNECPLQWLVSHGCATYRLQWGTSLPSCSTSWALVMLLRLQKKLPL